MRNSKGQFTKGHKGLRNSKYSDEDIIREGEKYDTPSDFSKGNKTFYTYATRRKILNKIKYKVGYKIKYYTDEFIINEAAKYDCPTEFQKNKPKVYSAAVHRKLLDKLVYKVGYIGNRVKRMVYVYEFSDNHFYVGLTYNEKKRELEHSIHGKTSVSKYMRETGLTPIKKTISTYINADDARLLEENTRIEYKKNGWIDINKRKCGALGTNERKWTIETIKEAFSTCKFREEAKDKYGSGLFNAAKQLGVYDEVTKDMPYMLNYYTKDEIIKIAKNYTTKQDFKLAHSSLYTIVYRNRWSDEVFNHTINGKCDYILDTQTGIFYMGYKDLLESTGINLSFGGLRSQLTGRTQNKTRFIKT
jgi:predicted GIY-YIG superfamily endonuclease